MSRRVLLLNQFLPPDPAPTARLAGDLMAALPELEWVAIGGRNRYQTDRKPGLVGRLRREWSDLRMMHRTGRQTKGVDAVVAFSSPPMLLAEAARLARHHRACLHHWVLDLYPDVAVALGQIPPLAGMWFQGPMRTALATCATVAAVDEAMAERIHQRYGVRCGLCRPWPEPDGGAGFQGWPGVPEDAPVWLYSGNLGRAHAWQALLALQTELERRNSPWWLVVQGGGTGWEAARKQAATQKLARSQFVPYAPSEQVAATMRHALVCVACQRIETAGMLWPSKAGALAERARAVLWLGPDLTGASNPLLKRDRVGCFRLDQIQAAAAWMEAVRLDPPAQPTPIEVGLREAGLAYWRNLLLP